MTGTISGLVCFSTFPSLIPVKCHAQAPQPGEAPSSLRKSRTPPSSRSVVTTVLLMRHGQTDWNLAGRVQGGLDKSRLNDTGLKQAREAGRWLQNIKVDGIYCSPLTRAQDTLRAAVQASGNTNLQSKKMEVLELLREIQVPWQGLLKTDIDGSFFSKLYLQYVRNPFKFSYNGFSPVRDLSWRARQVWQTVKHSPGSCYLIVSHNQMNKALICSALGLPTVLSAWRQGNCCFNVVVLEKGKYPRLRLCNGMDNAPVGLSLKKLGVRPHCMRIYLHHQGDWRGLQKALRASPVKASHFYLVGSTPRHDLDELGIIGLDSTCSRIPSLAASKNIYRAATSLLNELRRKHEGEIVVISTDNSEELRTIFSASLGLGRNGCQRLISDVGGVSVIDIRVSGRVGRAVTYVESYNTGAWIEAEALEMYARECEN